MLLHISRIVNDNKSGSFLLGIQLADGIVIESARLNHKDEVHFCLSTQAGCAIGCFHCATTYSEPRFVRSLTPQDMISVLRLLEGFRPCRPGPLVLSFSGHGEPLLNFDNVQSVATEIGHRFDRIHITTVGIVDRFDDLAALVDVFEVYLSLHGSSDEERQYLVPIVHPVATVTELLSFASRYVSLGGRVVLNYVGTQRNTSVESAMRLSRLLTSTHPNVELRVFPWNKVRMSNPIERATDDMLVRFIDVLRGSGVPNPIRLSRTVGAYVGIACGQLRAYI